MRSALRLASLRRECHGLIQFRWPCTIDRKCRAFSSSSRASQEDSSGTRSIDPDDGFVRAMFSPESVEQHKKERFQLSGLQAAVKKRERILGPLSTSDAAVEERLRHLDSSPATILRESIQDVTLSTHVIRLCLAAQYARAAKFPWKQRYHLLEMQRKDGLARLILDCLWKDEKLWTTLVFSDTNALFKLSYYAVLEGLSEYMIDWAFVTITDPASPLAGPGIHNTWRGTLLATLISAVDVLDSNGSADDTIRCFFAMVDKKQAMDASGTSFTSIYPAALRCEARLYNKSGTNSDGQLHDQFIAWWQANSPPRTRPTLRHLAKLGLAHPKSPTETFALQYLRLWDARYAAPESNKHQNRFLQRVLDVAVMNNNVENAAWIKEQFNDRLDPATGRFAPPLPCDPVRQEIQQPKVARSRQDPCKVTTCNDDLIPSEKQLPALGDKTFPIAFVEVNWKAYRRESATLSRQEVNLNRRSRGLGPLSASDLIIQERLDQVGSNATEILRQSIQDSTFSPHVIRLCLEAAHAKLSPLSRRHRLLLFKNSNNDGIARLALDCIWQDERLWSTIVVYDRNAVFLLSYFAILEKLDPMIEDWAFVDINDGINPLATDRSHNFWRGALLGELIGAHEHHKIGGDLAPTLQCFFRCVDKKAADDAVYNRVSLAKSAINLVGMIWQKGCDDTDEAIYDRFCEWVSHSDHFIDLPLNLAKLHLNHPTRPSETLALEYLREWSVGSRTPNLSVKTTQHYNGFLQRTLDVAIGNANLQDAAWIKQTFQNRLDSTGRRFAPPSKRDLFLREMERRRQATLGGIAKNRKEEIHPTTPKPGL